MLVVVEEDLDRFGVILEHGDVLPAVGRHLNADGRVVAADRGADIRGSLFTGCLMAKQGIEELRNIDRIAFARLVVGDDVGHVEFVQGRRIEHERIRAGTAGHLRQTRQGGEDIVTVRTDQ